MVLSLLALGSSPKDQIVAFLSRVGSDSAVKTAGIIAIAEGAIYNYCNRTTTAFRKLGEHFLKWPDIDERDGLSAAMTEYGSPDSHVFKNSDLWCSDTSTFYNTNKYMIVDKDAFHHLILVPALPICLWNSEPQARHSSLGITPQITSSRRSQNKF